MAKGKGRNYRWSKVRSYRWSELIAIKRTLAGVKNFTGVTGAGARVHGILK